MRFSTCLHIACISLPVEKEYCRRQPFPFQDLLLCVGHQSHAQREREGARARKREQEKARKRKGEREGGGERENMFNIYIAKCREGGTGS